MTAPTVWVDDHFVAGDVALDLANTVYRRTPEVGADLLGDLASLGTWLARTRLLPTEAPADLQTAVLEEARSLRGLLWHTLGAQVEGREVPPGALRGLLEVAGRGVGRGDPAVGADGTTTARTARGALAVLALRGVALALDPPPQGVRACDGCGWFFVDRSRGRRRRWCSMRTCGNQAKVARHRAGARRGDDRSDRSGRSGDEGVEERR